MNNKIQKIIAVIEYCKEADVDKDIIAALEQIFNSKLIKAGYDNNPTHIGIILSQKLGIKISAQKVNNTLTYLQFQKKDSKGNYIPTELGQIYSNRYINYVNDIIRIELRWSDEIIDILFDYFSDNHKDDNTLEAA